MLSLVHLIYMAGDKCMRQNACFFVFYKSNVPGFSLNQLSETGLKFTFNHNTSMQCHGVTYI